MCRQVQAASGRVSRAPPRLAEEGPMRRADRQAARHGVFERRAFRRREGRDAIRGVGPEGTQHPLQGVRGGEGGRAPVVAVEVVRDDLLRRARHGLALHIQPFGPFQHRGKPASMAWGVPGAGRGGEQPRSRCGPRPSQWRPPAARAHGAEADEGVMWRTHAQIAQVCLCIKWKETVRQRRAAGPAAPCVGW